MKGKMNVPGYEQLADVLAAAYEQAAKGKGAERHADGKPFHEQPMQTGSDLLGTDAGLAFQAIKKLREGMAFTDIDRWEREALGAINYIAGMVIWRRRQAMKCQQLPADDPSRDKSLMEKAVSKRLEPPVAVALVNEVADPFMLADSVWARNPMINWTAVDPNGDLKLFREEPSVCHGIGGPRWNSAGERPPVFDKMDVDSAKCWESSLRQRPAHLRREAATNGQ